MNEYKHLLDKLHHRQDLVASITDPAHFMERYAHVHHPSKGFIPFKPYDYQKELVTSFQNHNTITISARQTGMSITGAMFLKWYALNNPDREIVLLASKFGHARDLLLRIRDSFEAMPDDSPYSDIKITGFCNQVLSFSNGSRICASSASPDAMRGRCVHLLYVDDFGWVDQRIQEELMIVMGPMRATGTRIIMNSTGGGNRFYHDLYKDSAAGKTEFKAFHISWDLPPGRNENFKQETINMIGDDGWKQYYECGLKTKPKWWES